MCQFEQISVAELRPGDVLRRIIKDGAAEKTGERASFGRGGGVVVGNIAVEMGGGGGGGQWLKGGVCWRRAKRLQQETRLVAEKNDART